MSMEAPTYRTNHHFSEGFKEGTYLSRKSPLLEGVPEEAPNYRVNHHFSQEFLRKHLPAAQITTYQKRSMKASIYRANHQFSEGFVGSIYLPRKSPLLGGVLRETHTSHENHLHAPNENTLLPSQYHFPHQTLCHKTKSFSPVDYQFKIHHPRAKRAPQFVRS